MKNKRISTPVGKPSRKPRVLSRGFRRNGSTKMISRPESTKTGAKVENRMIAKRSAMNRGDQNAVAVAVVAAVGRASPPKHRLSAMSRPGATISTMTTQPKTVRAMMNSVRKIGLPKVRMRERVIDVRAAAAVVVVDRVVLPSKERPLGRKRMIWMTMKTMIASIRKLRP